MVRILDVGRELKRVPLDFDWAINETWHGYINPLHTARKCLVCEGSGRSPTAERLHQLWYGYAPFTPEDNGSEPFTETTPEVRLFAERNVARDPEYYGTGELAIVHEAKRLANHFNRQWSHHLNEDDVAALVAADRLYDLTKYFVPGSGWQPKNPSYVPTAREVNLWSIGGMGHDSSNQWIVTKAECARLGAPTDCDNCAGEGELWAIPEAKAAYEEWERTEPPEGDAYQMWQTVSEGSPISPPFATPEELARYMTINPWGADEGTTYETWLAFIRGPGWAPSGVVVEGQIMDGVNGIVGLSG